MNNNYPKNNKQQIVERKEKLCRNEFQRAVFELAGDPSQFSNAEFWTFLRGVEVCLFLPEKERQRIRKMI